jgi:hypothetical protein
MNSGRPVNLSGAPVRAAGFLVRLLLAGYR